MKQADLTDMFKKASKSVYMSVINTLTFTPSASSAMKMLENTKNNPDDPEPANGDSQMEHSTD
jgi:hypothetical protein